MTKERWEELLERLCRLLEDEQAGSTDALRSELRQEKPEDIVLAMQQLEPDQAVAVFTALEEPCAAEVISKVDPELAKRVTEHLRPGHFTHLVERLPPRVAAQVVASAPRAQVKAFLADASRRRPSAAKEVENRLDYPEGTAGRLMTGSFVRLRPEMTVEEAVEVVRRTNPKIDIPDDLCVVEEERSGGQAGDRLVGVLSIRELMMAEPHQRIGEIMATDVVSVRADAREQDAASLMSTYEFLALPVLDGSGYLVGVIPVDDLMRLVVAKLYRRYAQAVGTDAEAMTKLSPLQAARLRVPWLLGTMGIELGSGLVISHFDQVLKQVILLASFMPVISAISGNVGLQAAAITVRALDTGQVTLRDRWVAVRKEAATTFLMALVCGVVLGGIGIVWSKHLLFGLVIGAALACAMLTAGSMGTVIPLVSKRLGFDPATTAGPFETAFQDVIGFAVFLWLASLLLRRLA